MATDSRWKIEDTPALLAQNEIDLLGDAIARHYA